MTDFDEAMLDIAWKNLDCENNRFKDIDAKAIGIITISGVLITFLAKPETVSVGNLSSILFALTALSFLVTILLCILVIRTRRAAVLSTKNLIEYLKDESTERQIGGIIGTIAESAQSIQKVCNKKAEELTLAVYALGISVILLIFYSLSRLF